MKKCPYCGKEYPDDATNCALDNELLLDDSPQLAADAKHEVETETKKDEPYLTFPDYKWSARDGWKCVGMLFLFGFIFFIPIGLLYFFFRTSQKAGSDIFQDRFFTMQLNY